MLNDSEMARIMNAYEVRTGAISWDGITPGLVYRWNGEAES